MKDHGCGFNSGQPTPTPALAASKDDSSVSSTRLSDDAGSIPRLNDNELRLHADIYRVVANVTRVAGRLPDLQCKYDISPRFPSSGPSAYEPYEPRPPHRKLQYRLLSPLPYQMAFALYSRRGPSRKCDRIW